MRKRRVQSPVTDKPKPSLFVWTMREWEAGKPYTPTVEEIKILDDWMSRRRKKKTKKG